MDDQRFDIMLARIDALEKECRGLRRQDKMFIKQICQDGRLIQGNKLKACLLEKRIKTLEDWLRIDGK